MAQQPKFLKVGSKVYRFIWTAENWEEGHYGKSDHFKLNIAINTNAADDQQRDTVFHEIMHCCFSQIGNPKNYSNIEEPEEHWVTTLTPWILLVLQENPIVLDFILGVEEQE